MKLTDHDSPQSWAKLTGTSGVCLIQLYCGEKETVEVKFAKCIVRLKFGL